jgi:hypothetical protein
MFKEEANKPLSEHKRTSEHASYIIEAMETGRPYRGHFNRRNNGIITNLPDDAIIESPGYVDRFGINMIEGITLPTACAATCSVSVSVQRLSVEAAMTGNLDTLKLAVLHDPARDASVGRDAHLAQVLTRLAGRHLEGQLIGILVEEHQRARLGVEQRRHRLDDRAEQFRQVQQRIEAYARFRQRLPRPSLLGQFLFQRRDAIFHHCLRSGEGVPHPPAPSPPLPRIASAMAVPLERGCLVTDV